MNAVIRSLAVLFLLLFTVYVNAQFNSETYNAEIEKYKLKERRGNILLISGASTLLIGGGCFIIGATQLGESTALAGLGISAVGVGLIIPGIINKSIGKRKKLENQLLFNVAQDSNSFNNSRCN